MPACPFHLVDVFAERRYTGNQLAVVRETESLTDEQLQRIAAEMDYAETAFVHDDPHDAGYDMRVFTPNTELPFAGHPALGTAQVLREHAGAGEEVILHLPSGPTTVTVAERDHGDVYWMHQTEPDFGDTIDPVPVATVLGLDTGAISPDWPVQAVSTGLETLIVPLMSRDALGEAGFDRAAFREFTEGRETRHLTLVTPDPRDDENDLVVRVLRDETPPDDAATGSANGCLAAYLAEHGCLGSPSVDVRVEQGYGLGRPSLLFLRADANTDDYDVRVGGRVVPVADGTLR